MVKTHELARSRRHLGPDGLRIRWWMAAYLGYLAALITAVVVKLHRLGHEWTDLFTAPRQFFLTAEHTALKLLIYTVYLSIACTILPLNTGWLVSMLAMRQFHIAEGLWPTTLVVATVGAMASMIANVHDYHLFTWILRSKSAARIRHTRFYHKAERWFSRRPFVLVAAFNLIPIPVDMVRLLAVSYRYPLRRFALANFLGRWVRYAAIAAVTFALGPQGWVMVVLLLGVALAWAVAKLVRRMRGRTPPAGDVAGQGVL
ncbi:MAG TPA: VTT domain-containing protein [Phycisphaerae bacterium]|nr:VTT domain-containing protein [Phycisphaerae bacterium]